MHCWKPSQSCGPIQPGSARTQCETSSEEGLRAFRRGVWLMLKRFVTRLPNMKESGVDRLRFICACLIRRHLPRCPPNSRSGEHATDCPHRVRLRLMAIALADISQKPQGTAIDTS